MIFTKEKYVPFKEGRFRIQNLNDRFDTNNYPEQYKGKIKEIRLIYGEILIVILKEGTVKNFIYKNGMGKWKEVEGGKSFTFLLREKEYFISYDRKTILCLKIHSSEYEIYLYKK